jgi:hypothetical protein
VNDLSIQKIFTNPHVKFRLGDYIINILNIHTHHPACDSPYVIYYVSIKNIKTGVVFNDWIKPYQCDSLKEIHKLTDWNRGEVLLFCLAEI